MAGTGKRKRRRPLDRYGAAMTEAGSTKDYIL